jgi:hypothetical protein
VVGDAPAALEIVGFDLAHGQRRAGVVAEPGRGPDVVAVCVGDDMLHNVTSAQEPSQPTARPPAFRVIPES